MSNALKDITKDPILLAILIASFVTLVGAIIPVTKRLSQWVGVFFMSLGVILMSLIACALVLTGEELTICFLVLTLWALIIVSASTIRIGSR